VTSARYTRVDQLCQDGVLVVLCRSFARYCKFGSKNGLLSEESDAHYAVHFRGLIQVPFQIFFGRFVAYVSSDDDAAQLMPRSAPELGRYLFMFYVVFLYDFHFVPFNPGVWAVDFYHQADHCRPLLVS
jgi:hypothetical protein